MLSLIQTEAYSINRRGRHNLRPHILMITLLSIMGAVVAGSVWSESRLIADANRLQTSMESLEASLLSGNWSIAEKQLKQLAGSWGEFQNRWDLVVRASKMDDLSIAMSCLNRAVTIHERERALDALAAIAASVDTIVSQERFTLRNIF